MDWIDNRQRGRARLAQQLMKLGFNVHGYTEGKTETSNLLELAEWRGWASHPDYPQYRIVVGITPRNAPTYVQLDWPKFPFIRTTELYIVYRFDEKSPDGAHLTSGTGASACGYLEGGTKMAEDIAARLKRQIEHDARRIANKAKREAKAAEVAANKARREANKLAGVKNTRPKQDKPAEPGAPATQSPETAAPATPSKPTKPAKTVELKLPPISPLVTDRRPLIADAIVANLTKKPTWFPKNANYTDFVAGQVAEYYGFDKGKIDTAAKTIETMLLQTPAGEAPQTNTLRSTARQLLN